MEADYGHIEMPRWKDRLVATLYGMKRKVANRIKSRGREYGSALEAQLLQDFRSAFFAADLELKEHKHLLPADVFYTELMSRMQKSQLYSAVTNGLINKLLYKSSPRNMIDTTLAFIKVRPLRLNIDSKEAVKYLPDRLKSSAQNGKLVYCTYEPISMGLNARELEGLLLSALINRSERKRFTLDYADDTDWLGMFLGTGKTLRVKTSTGSHFAYMREAGSKAIANGLIDFSKKPSLPVTLYDSLKPFFSNVSECFGIFMSAPFALAYGLYYSGYPEYASDVLGVLYSHIPVSQLSHLTGMDLFFIPAFAFALWEYASALKRGASSYLRKRKEYLATHNSASEKKLAISAQVSS